MWFPTRSDTNRAVQSQKMARGWKFWIQKVEELCIRVAKTKALISFAVTAKLICAFVFTYAECWFSHEAAEIYDLSHYMYLYGSPSWLLYAGLQLISGLHCVFQTKLFIFFQ